MCMVNIEMLTKEHGFINGVSILVNTIPYIFKELLIGVNHVWIDGGHHFINIKNIESIKILTGPMSIWSNAPDWANYAEIREFGIFWHYAAPFWYDKLSPVIQKRPWWAKVETEFDKEIEAYDRSKA